VPPGKLPFDIGFLVQNVGTVLAVYEAVYLDKPLIERSLTVSGDCLHRPGNFMVRVGTSIKDIADNYGIELYKEPAKVIVGGPMMGFSQPHMDSAVLKSTSGILFLSAFAAKSFDEEPCIRCAKCVDVCPMNLVPTDIMRNAKKNLWGSMEELYVSDCMECGACAYICPSRIPIVQYIKSAKAALRKK
ncbi:MAG: 4Fe-4S dicluster domain-containing protein, partial [Candidatus Omnitrophota bacterium]